MKGLVLLEYAWESWRWRIAPAYTKSASADGSPISLLFVIRYWLFVISALFAFPQLSLTLA